MTRRQQERVKSRKRGALSGAAGFRAVPAVRVAGALRELCAELERLIADGLLRTTLEPPPTTRLVLTPRQIEILGRIAAGRSTESIARELWLPVATVRNHVARILRALDAHS